MISNNTGVSSNRAINICMVVFMVGVMITALIIDIPIEHFRTILEYSLYIFIASLTTKSAEKITGLIKNKSAKTTDGPEL